MCSVQLYVLMGGCGVKLEVIDVNVVSSWR